MNELKNKPRKMIWGDLETTGLSTKDHGIIEVAFIVDIDNEIAEEKVFTMKPTGKGATDKALEINGFTREQIRNFTCWFEVYKDFSFWLNVQTKKYYQTEKFILGGHNVSFDNRFLLSWDIVCDQNSWSNVVYQNSFVDTMKMIKNAQKYGQLDYKGSASLGAACANYNIRLDNAHNALADTRASRDLYYKLEDETWH